MNRKFDFDDILIKPEKKSHINSRYVDITLPPKLPIFTAPMDTVVNLSNYELFIHNKINVVLPRTVKYDEIYFNDIKHIDTFISFGFEKLDELYKNNFKELFENIHILIDVANAHSVKVLDYAKEIKRIRPDIIIMVGNIANPETYRWYAESNSVDYIRLGIGNGGGCTTTKNGSVGYPMASLIHETKTIKNEMILNGYDNLPKIVADGGMKNYADIIKALALGADMIMVGSIFNKTIESCGDSYLYGVKLNNKIAKIFFDRKFPVKKYFRGMSTKEAQKAMGKSVLKTSEGVIRYRKVEYTLSGWVENFEHYLRSAMSYSNCKTLEEFTGSSNFIQITENSYNRFNK